MKELMKKTLPFLFVILLGAGFIVCDWGDESDETTFVPTGQPGGECTYNVAMEFRLDEHVDSGESDVVVPSVSGSDFKIYKVPTYLTNSSSTCPKVTDGPFLGGDSIPTTVERDGNTLKVIAPLGTTEFTLSGDALSSTPFNVDDAFCINVLSEVSGTIDYAGDRITINYKKTVTDTGMGYCPAF